MGAKEAGEPAQGLNWSDGRNNLKVVCVGAGRRRGVGARMAARPGIDAFAAEAEAGY